jgi:hypothetical protein
MILFYMQSGIKRYIEECNFDKITKELEHFQHPSYNAILYDASGYDAIELVKCILYSLDYIEKDFAFDIVDALEEIRRERNRAWDKINGVDFDYEGD